MAARGQIRLPGPAFAAMHLADVHVRNRKRLVVGSLTAA
jgi:hypothetical protein